MKTSVFGLMAVATYVAVCTVSCALAGEVMKAAPYIGEISRFHSLSDVAVAGKLSSPTPQVRAAAAKELGRRGVAVTVGGTELRSLLGDSSEMVGASAAAVLLDAGDDAMRDRLAAYLASKDEQTALIAAAGLARHGDARGVPVARLGLKSKLMTHRRLALDTLGYAGDSQEAKSAIEGALRDNYLRVFAVDILSKRHDKFAVDALASVRGVPFNLERMKVADAIAKVGLNDGIPLLIDMLADSDVSVANSALSALVKLTGRKTAALDSTNRVPALMEDWLDWWRANRDKYPLGQPSRANEASPAK